MLKGHGHGKQKPDTCNYIHVSYINYCGFIIIFINCCNNNHPHSNYFLGPFYFLPVACLWPFNTLICNTGAHNKKEWSTTGPNSV